MMSNHILIVTFPAQGHINPSLQFAKCLLKIGFSVTFTTSFSAHRRISATGVDGIKFAPFSDGYDDGFNIDVDDPVHYMSEIRFRGSQKIREIIAESEEKDCRVCCVVYTLLLSWAHTVAKELRVTSALLWIQPATVLGVYYYYFNGYDEIISNSTSKDPSWCIELPGLPLFQARDLPSFLLASNPYKYALSSFEEQIEMLQGEENPIVLVNTFHMLEPDALQAIPKLKMIAIGPLIPSSFLDGREHSDNKSYGGDLFKESNNYMEFLNSKQESSVVYVSFGSLLTVKDIQLQEIARGILETRRPFLWVLREGDKDESKIINYREELDKQGMIVSWCSQLNVLNHRSIGCFVTHCGWNSTLESLACGVPVVAFPHWSDQATNAKLIVDVWGTGVRVQGRESDAVVDGGEISKCVDVVMSDGDESVYKKNAMKWKVLSKEALRDGGFIDKNLKEFFEGLCNN